jgi:acetoacetyl-[acyl-carrier protein] synthase
MLAAVPDVFVHADGAKKSVTGPGAGNYVTMARATALMRAIVGEQRLAAGGMVHAHGTGTPQNRVTESAIFNDIAAAFGIGEWPVVAVKSFIGHSLGAASGDQLSAALGIWDTNMLPAIKTIDAIAPDVAAQHLSFVLQTTERRVADYALINSKGFGGNNATAALLSPESAHSLVREHHGASAFKAWQTRNEALLTEREALEARRLAGDWAPRYIFNEGVVDVADIAITQKAVTLGNKRVNLQVDLPQGWSLN